MNKKFSSILIGVLMLSIGIVSCNKDPKITIEDEGVPAKMTLSLEFSNQGTRATTDPNATEAEAEIKTVDVIVYNATTGTQVITSLTATDFDDPTAGTDADRYVGETDIQTTTGPKNVYVAINRPASITIANVTEEQLAETVQNISADLVANTTTGFVMFSTNTATINVTTGSDNKVTATVSRLASKVTVKKHSNYEVTFGGTITDLAFITGNVNTKGFLLPDAAGKDPNYTAIQHQNAHFVTEDPTAFIAVNETAVTVKDLSPKYITENTSATDNKAKKGLTRVIIRVSYIPATILVGNSTDGFTEESVVAVTAQDFWTVIDGTTRYFFFDEGIADDYMNSKSIVDPTKKAKYTDGYAYYNMWLNPGNNWNVFRNTYLNCNIKRILALGNPNFDIDNEEDEEPSITENMEITIDVLHWTLASSDFELEP